MYTVADLRDDVSGLLQGMNLNQVTNLYGAFERAASTLAQKADPPEASGRESLMLYDGVFYYPAPETIFGGALVDLRPQGQATYPDDYVYKVPVDVFNRTKCYLPNGYEITFEYDKGVGIMGVTTPNTTPKLVLDTCSDVDGWSAGGDASGLALDRTVYYEQPAALRFNLAAAGTQGYIEKNISSSDLTAYEGTGVVFVAVDLPNADGITAIGARLGSSSADYYEMSATEGFLGAWVSGQYLLVALDLATATTVGSPDITAMDYLRVFFDYDGVAQVNVRVGYVFISLPSPVELLFQSSALFLHDGTLSITITDDNDQIILNAAAYLLYQYECAKTVAFQSGGTLSSGVVQTILAELDGQGNQQGLYDRYRADNPSQELRTLGSYYDNY